MDTTTKNHTIICLQDKTCFESLHSVNEVPQSVLSSSGFVVRKKVLVAKAEVLQNSPIKQSCIHMTVQRETNSCLYLVKYIW